MERCHKNSRVSFICLGLSGDDPQTIPSFSNSFISRIATIFGLSLIPFPLRILFAAANAFRVKSKQGHNNYLDTYNQKLVSSP